MATATDTDLLPTPAVRTAGRLTRVGAAWARPGLSVVAAGLVALAASRSGGYFPEDHLLLGTVAFVASAVGLWAVGPRWRPTRAATVALCSLLALAAWTGLSAAWSPDPGGASLAMARTLGYAGAFLLAMLAVGDGRHAGLLLRLLVLVLVGIATVALLGRLRPDLFATDSAIAYPAQGRLASVITYWNGLGAVTAMAVIGAVSLAGDARERAGVRAAAAAGGVLATCAMYLTLSRGTALALAAGVTIVLLLSPRRWRLGTSMLLILGGGLVGILVLRQHPILVDMPGTEAARIDEGGPLVLLLGAVAVLAGLVQALLTRLRVPSRRATDTTRPRPRLSPVVAALPVITVLVALVGVYVAVGPRVEGQANDNTGSLRSFVDRQYVSFMNPVSAPSARQDRLTSAQSTRSDVYRVALDGLRGHPVAGDGAGAFRVRWFRERRSAEDVRNAHSLELETLSELGAVGGALLLAFLGSLLVGLRAMVRRRGAITRTQGAGAAGIVVVWLVHSALDWDWQMAAVTLPALICGAMCLAPDRLPASRSGRSRRHPRPAL